MAQITVPIKIDLPEDWLGQIVERIKQDGDWQVVIRCNDCEFYSADELSEKERFDHEQDWAAEGIQESVLDREYHERMAAEYYGDDYDEEEWDETD